MSVFGLPASGFRLPLAFALAVSLPSSARSATSGGLDGGAVESAPAGGSRKPEAGSPDTPDGGLAPTAPSSGATAKSWINPAELSIPNSSLDAPGLEAGPVISLPQLIELARSADPRARQAYAQVERSQAKRDETWWVWFPTFDFQIGAGGPVSEARLKGGNNDPNLQDVTDATRYGSWSNVGVAIKSSITAILPIWTFGKISAGNQAAQHAVSAQEALLLRARDQATFDVTRAYWGFQTTHFGLQSIENVRGQIADARKRAKEMLDDGSDQLTRADLTRLDYVAEEIEAAHAGQVKNEALAITGLRLLCGIEPGQPLHIAHESLPPPPQQPGYEEMVKLGLDRRPEARAARENIAARRALVDLEKARFYPDVGLIGQYSWNYQSNADSPVSPFVNNPNAYGALVALGVRGTLDIPQKFARYHQAEADVHEAQALLAGAESLLRLELQQALGDLAEARIRVERYTKEAAIGKQLLVQASLALDSGLGSAQELVIDAFMFSRAEGERLRAVMDAQAAWAGLEKAVGTAIPQRPALPPPAMPDAKPVQAR